MPESSILLAGAVISEGLRSLSAAQSDDHHARALAIAYRELTVQHAVTRLLAEADSLESAAMPLLGVVGEGLNWDLGAIWLAMAGDPHLTAASVWTRHPGSFSDFAVETRTRTLAPSGPESAGWVERDFGSFLQSRLEQARAVGLPSMRAALIRDSTGALGIVEFFASGMGDSPQSSHSLADVGWQIGHFLRRKRAEEALRRSEEQYRLLFENLPVGLYRIAPDGHLLMANPTLVRLLGHDNLDEAVRPEIGRRVLGAGVDAALRELCVGQGEVLGLESDWPAESGVLHVRENIRAVRDASGELLCFQGSVEDITEQKRAEGELRRHAQWLEEAQRTLEMQAAEIAAARDAALEASRLKSQFLANVSHEIRTPMNGIIGMTDLALSTGLNAEQREYLDMVSSSAHALLALINDLLDFSKIEAGRLELDPAPFSLRAMIDEWLKPMRVRAVTAGLDFEWHVAATVPDDLVGDAPRLRQVLINLVGNALKFTDSGSVMVLVDTSGPRDPRSVRLRFAVSDTGAGVPRDKLTAIFEPFTQADGSSTRKHGGTGLGLSICSQLLALMGGRIWVSSEPGIGSTFFVEVEFAVGAEAVDVRTPSTGADPPVQSRQCRILLAEDHAISRRLATRLLERHGHTVTAVESGRAVIEELAKGRYDLALLDLDMPELNGLDTARRIRSGSLGGARLPLIALTGRAGESDRAECLAAGIDEVVTKPVRPDELSSAIRRLTA